MAPQVKPSTIPEVVCVYEHQQDRRTPTQMPLEGRAPTLKLRPSHSMQTAAEIIAERKPDKTVVLTDSKAALQSLNSDAPDQAIRGLQEGMRRLPH